MKTFLLVLLACLLGSKMHAQNPEEEMNVLIAPISPASSLLGFAVSDIEKPTDVSEFMASLQSNTNSFTALPSNYAIDIAPFLLFNKGSLDITTKGMEKGKTFEQSLVLSFAVRNTDSLETLLNKESFYGGFGFKFSILRGEYDTETQAKLQSIKTLQNERLVILDSKVGEYNSIPDVMALREKRLAAIAEYGEDHEEVKELNRQIQEIMDGFFIPKDDKLEANAKKIKEIAAAFQIARVGWNWDVAGGISAEFINRNFSSSRVNNSGVWTTFGYTYEKSGSLLGLVRYLYNPDKIFADDNAVNNQEDISTLDAGMRYIFGGTQSKFNASLETIYRSVVGNSSIDASWRLVFNADYAIYKNQKLTFSFGRNYDGTTSKDGNLIAALSFVKGFGNKRNVK